MRTFFASGEETPHYNFITTPSPPKLLPPHKHNYTYPYSLYTGNSPETIQWDKPEHFHELTLEDKERGSYWILYTEKSLSGSCIEAMLEKTDHLSIRNTRGEYYFDNLNGTLWKRNEETVKSQPLSYTKTQTKIKFINNDCEIVYQEIKKQILQLLDHGKEKISLLHIIIKAYHTNKGANPSLNLIATTLDTLSEELRDTFLIANIETENPKKRLDILYSGEILNANAITIGEDLHKALTLCLGNDDQTLPKLADMIEKINYPSSIDYIDYNDYFEPLTNLKLKDLMPGIYTEYLQNNKDKTVIEEWHEMYNLYTKKTINYQKFYRHWNNIFEQKELENHADLF